MRDDNELRKGEGIWPNLVHAIHQSKISIPIFSSSYAHSKWCLKELVEIIEHQKREKGHIILPIFYKVDPQDVRHQTGPYKSAFQQHKRNKFDEKTIQSWKAALNEVGSLKGWHIKTKEEEVDVADVVSQVVWSHLSKNNNALETDELVGIDDQVERVVDMLDLDSKGVNLVGIHGMGGIGKTTLATAVYNNILPCFDRYSFVEDIRETQKQKDSVLILQKKFISNILRMDSVGSVVEAKKIIRERVTQFKILVVLDEVDEKFNFEEVLGNPKGFALGSRFIVTSRDIKVLMRLSKGECKLYEVQGLNPSCSLQLFCKHAFKKDFPLSGFETLSKKIVSTARGLPLALKVIGSLLYLEEEVVWKDKLEQLVKMPEKGVMDRLIISYNALEYEAQQIFLDIACFYIGVDKEMASYMWSDCNFHPVSNVNVLVQRSMLKIGDRNEFLMHDQLRDMGREIIRRESIEHPCMRSRIWSDKEAVELLVNNKGTSHIKAIRLDSVSDDVLESRCFANLPELRYLAATETSIIGDFSHLLPNLKWMQLGYRKYSRFSQPTSLDCMATFNVKNMIIFDVSRSECDFIHTKEAYKLKVLILSNCGKMSKLPEFPESRSLEILYLRRFKNKEEDLKIEKLCNLKVLRLEFPCQLGKIKGGTIGMMKELRELHLSHIECDYGTFRRAIADIEELPLLEILNVESFHLVDVLKGIKLPKSLKKLDTSSAFANLEDLLELEEFTIRGDRLTTELVIPPAASSTGDTIPWINSSKLKSMVLKFMKGIIMVGSKDTMLPSSLTKLYFSYVDSERIPNLKNLRNLTELRIWYCSNFQEVQGLGGMKSLQILRIHGAKKLTRVDGLGEMKSLQILHIHGAKKLTHVDGLGNLMSSFNCKLTELWISDCPLLCAVLTLQQLDDDNDDDDDDDDDDANDVRIESSLHINIQGVQIMDHGSIPRLSKFPTLRKLSFGQISSNINSESGSQQHQLLEELENLEELVELRVYSLPKVQRLPSLSKLRKLRILILEDLPGLREIAGLEDLKSLIYLNVRKCFSLERLPIADLPYSSMHDIELDLRGCRNFINIDSDLSPLTTRGADLCQLRVIIKWPHEILDESDAESSGESFSAYGVGRRQSR
ncbi:Disease resistance protein L6 [Linum perenne]